MVFVWRFVPAFIPALRISAHYTHTIWDAFYLRDRLLATSSGSSPRTLNQSRHQICFNLSRWSRKQSFTARARSSHLRPRNPCLLAFVQLAAFPSSLLGPVDCAHGFQLWISAASRFSPSGISLGLGAAKTLCRFVVKRYHLCTIGPCIQHISPLLHHLGAVGHVCRLVVCAPHRVGFDVG